MTQDVITLALEIQMTGGQEGGRLPDYSGSYTVTPDAVAQTLATKNKSLTDDITVNAVYCNSVENPSGGNTVTIIRG